MSIDESRARQYLKVQCDNVAAGFIKVAGEKHHIDDLESLCNELQPVRSKQETDKCALQFDEALRGEVELIVASYKRGCALGGKDRAEILTSLIDAQTKRFMQTRDIEIKVNLAIWAVILGGAIALRDKSIAVPWWYGLILLLIHLTWILLIRDSQVRDSTMIGRWRRETQAMVGVHGNEPSSWLPLKAAYWLWAVAELVATIMLLVIAWHLLPTK